MNKEEFIKELEKININITDKQLNQLERFYQLLIEWNEKINLTSITKKEEVYLKHFYDSLTLVKAVDLTQKLTLCDVGSGAGFPGIVLKIVFPNLNITLVDSLNKRVKYLNEIIKELDLNNIEAIHMRMEDFSKTNEEKYDIITARAVANTKILTEISIKSLKIGGYLIFMKANVEEELTNIHSYLKSYGCSFIDTIKFVLPKEKSTRTLVIIKKIEKTNKKYPRRIDQIKKTL